MSCIDISAHIKEPSDRLNYLQYISVASLVVVVALLNIGTSRTVASVCYIICCCIGISIGHVIC